LTCEPAQSLPLTQRYFLFWFTYGKTKKLMDDSLSKKLLAVSF
jgi:hypothetical protein